MLQRYQACMVLHAVGDSMGYYGGEWEFNKSGESIHKELKAMGGIKSLILEPKRWPVSDDTVLHLAVAECLIENKNLKPDKALFLKLIPYYKNAMNDMSGRAPGGTTIGSVNRLTSANPDGYKIPFNPQGAGCGASMRASCIGLRYPNPNQLDDLIAFSIESSRMTHHLPLGYLGGFVAALFTAFAIQGQKIENWGIEMIKLLPQALKYIENSGHCVTENQKNWEIFETKFMEYLKLRNIDHINNEVKFPDNYDVIEREAFYGKIGSRWPGALGYDSVIIAYDALLGSKSNWEQLCLRAAIHGGDNDSTGCIAASWYGALYGFVDVPENNIKELEYLDRLRKCGTDLYEIAKQNQ